MKTKVPMEQFWSRLRMCWLFLPLLWNQSINQPTNQSINLSIVGSCTTCSEDSQVPITYQLSAAYYFPSTMNRSNVITVEAGESQSALVEYIMKAWYGLRSSSSSSSLRKGVKDVYFRGLIRDIKSNYWFLQPQLWTLEYSYRAHTARWYKERMILAFEDGCIN